MSQNELHYWADCPLPPMRVESHFGDRMVHCFAERAPSVHALFDSAVERFGEREALVCGDERLTYRELDERVAAAAAGLAAHGVGAGERVVLYVSNRVEFVVALYATQRLGAVTVPVSVREQRDGLTYIVRQCGARAIVFDADLASRLPQADAVPQLQLRVACAALGDGVRGVSAPQVSAGKASAGETSAGETSAGETSVGEPSAGDACAGEPSAGEMSKPASFEFQVVDFDALCTVPAAQRLRAAFGAYEEETAVILYTSGTTGRPKGAMHTHLNVVHSALHYVACMRLTEADRSIMAVPASHVTGLIANIAALIAVGGATIVMPEFRADAFLALAARERMTHTLMVPAMYNLCLRQPDFDAHDLSAWRIGGYGGAPMPVATIDALAARLPGLGLMNAYGATETTSPTTMMPATLTRGNADSVGVPLPCAEVLVIDEDGRELPRGEVGEIWIGGPMVVRGYWDNPEATGREFTAGFWHSGDLGSIDADGMVRVFDRKKDMLNRGGYKIYSVEVENLLLSFPGVIEAAVVGKPCPVLGERVHAFVHLGDGAMRMSGAEGAAEVTDVSDAIGATVATEASTASVEPVAPGVPDPSDLPDEAALRAFCAAHLADYKVPESITLTDAPLPRNANGKLLKRELRERLSTQRP